MLFVVSSSDVSLFYNCDFELLFALNEKQKVEVSVFARCFEDGNAYLTYVGDVSYRDAIEACDMRDVDIRKQLKSDENVKPIRVYREYLPLSWKNRAKYRLRLDELHFEATVLIADFKNQILVSPKAMRRAPRFFGGFSLVQLERDELVKIDDKKLIFTGSSLRLPMPSDDITKGDLVDCTGILHRGTILAPTITLF